MLSLTRVFIFSRVIGGRAHFQEKENRHDQASLGTHLSFILVTVFMSFQLSVLFLLIEIEFKWTQYVFSGMPVFKLSMLAAWIGMQLVSHLSPFLRFNRDWFMRLCGLMLDLLIICALTIGRSILIKIVFYVLSYQMQLFRRTFVLMGWPAYPKISSMESTHYLVCGLFVFICLSWNFFCFIYLAKELFPNYWYLM